MNLSEQHQQLRILMLIVFIGFIGTSVAYPILPPLFMHPTAHSIVSIHWSAHFRAIMLGITLAIFPFAMFIGAPILGQLSDRWGRKKVIVISLAGALIGYTITALGIKYNQLWLLMIGRFLSGLLEGNIAIARSMAIDLKAIPRQKSLGRINAMCTLGYIVGPLIGGIFADHHLCSYFNYTLPFYIASAIVLTAFILSVTKLQSYTHNTNHEARSICKQLNILHRLKNLSKHPGLLPILWASTIFTLAVDIFYEFGAVFLTVKWHMSSAQIAIYIIGLSICLTIGNMSLPPWLSTKTSLRKAIMYSIAASAVLFFLIPLSHNPWITLIPYSLIGFSVACSCVNLTTQLSNSADDNIQGEVMGTQLGVRMLGDTIICLISSALLIASVNLPLLLSGLISVLALLAYKRTQEK
jgi:MFS transporter, DHA1 family, tetracycline resistance protein